MPDRTKRRFLLTLLCLLVLAWPALADDETLTLTILHTNDLHGHILPFAYTETGRGPEEKPSVGGAARRATLIRRIRKEAKNPVVLVDSGDTFTRGPFTNAYEGIADVEAMNAVGYEMAAIGNNEFKAKDATEAGDAAGAQAALLAVIKRARFPWLCANATDQKGAILEGVQPFIVRQYGPVRVGFLGLTAPRSASYPQTKGWTISDPVAAAKEYIPKARAMCDVLIAVTHIGVGLDKQLAAQTTGLDAIVGGDSHTFLYKAVEVKNADGSATVPIVQDGEFGVNLGRFDLTFAHSDAGWKLKGYQYELIPVNDKIAEARDVQAAIEPFARPMMAVVGKLPAEKIGKTPEERNRLTTQVLVDALRRQTGADFALNPVMSGFFDVFRRPEVRRYDVFAAMPFKNHAVIATLTGAQVQEMAKPADAIVSGDTGGIEPAKTYRVALVDFIAKTNYKLSESAITDTGKDIRDLVIADIGAAK
jgi:2',3'-cyclic-nucleotide 2'-phosphodiesterase (5'-nucleotidase family)